jgi:hypothetical protein
MQIITTAGFCSTESAVTEADRKVTSRSLRAMFPTAAPWLLFNVWAGWETTNNTVATITTAYTSPFTVTRDEIPNLQ